MLRRLSSFSSRFPLQPRRPYHGTSVSKDSPRSPSRRAARKRNPAQHNFACGTLAARWPAPCARARGSAVVSGLPHVARGRTAVATVAPRRSRPAFRCRLIACVPLDTPGPRGHGLARGLPVLPAQGARNAASSAMPPACRARLRDDARTEQWRAPFPFLISQATLSTPSREPQT
jgi:hypothetical protein